MATGDDDAETPSGEGSAGASSSSSGAPAVSAAKKALGSMLDGMTVCGPKSEKVKDGKRTEPSESETEDSGDDDDDEKKKGNRGRKGKKRKGGKKELTQEDRCLVHDSLMAELYIIYIL